jgi:hypothetical protein
MARPRNSVAKLERMLRVVEPGANNLGRYLAEHGEELADRLHVDVATLSVLADLPDEQITPLLKQLFEHRASERSTAHQAEVRDMALAVAQQLGATAVWTNDIAMLDVRLLLGELLVDTTRSYITLDAGSTHGGFRVSLPRSLLVNAARELGQRPDLVAWVDQAGLNFRWNQERGGLNFFSQRVPASEAANVLTVSFLPPLVRLHRAPTRSGWFSDLLSEVALA